MKNLNIAGYDIRQWDDDVPCTFFNIDLGLTNEQASKLQIEVDAWRTKNNVKEEIEVSQDEYGSFRFSANTPTLKKLIDYFDEYGIDCFNMIEELYMLKGSINYSWGDDDGTGGREDRTRMDVIDEWISIGKRSQSLYPGCDLVDDSETINEILVCHYKTPMNDEEEKKYKVFLALNIS